MMLFNDVFGQVHTQANQELDRLSKDISRGVTVGIGFVPSVIDASNMGQTIGEPTTEDLFTQWQQENMPTFKDIAPFGDF